jgi:prepilin-type N-terminal cleavage/methylation domain-containing protein
MKKKAFTLIELLVVISIIAMLMAIMMPALAKVRKQAKVVICGTRLKQNIYGASLAANDNKGKLPKGGYNYYDKRIDMTYNRDDAIGIRAEEYLNMCEYIVGIGGSIDTNLQMHPREMEPIARKLIKSKAKLNFTCPELEKQENDLSLANAKSIFRGEKIVTKPFIMNYGNAGWYTRLGFCYLAGFDTDKWDWDSIPDVAERWRSPMTISDSGDSPVITDRFRYFPSQGGWLTPTHSKINVTYTEGIMIGVMDPYEVARKYSDVKINIGKLDGSVTKSRIGNLKPHQGSMVDNSTGSYYSDGDYYFW